MKGLLNNLIHINRFSGSQLLKQESVSDHIWGMMALAFENLPYINQRRTALGLPLVDKKDLIYRISVHDIDEAYTLDIPRLFKYYNSTIHSAIETVSQEIMNKYLDRELVADVNSAKNTKCIEGLYVKLLDFIQCGLKMVNEVKLGNSIIKSELPNVIGCLVELRSSLNPISNQVEIEFIDEYLTILRKYAGHE